MRNPYDILGVAKTAGEAEIKKAFRKQAKVHHPDRNADDPRAKDKFAELNAAYEIVGDPEKRAQFDRGEIGPDGKPRFQGFGGGRASPDMDFESFNFGRAGPKGGAGIGDDIFSQLFGEAFRSAGRPGAGRASAARSPGEDVAATLTVTLEEVASEAKKRVALPTGREVEVTVPKGVVDGQVIRLRGLGRGGPMSDSGDALLTIRIAPHENFTVEGPHLRHRLAVALEDAILGAKLRVPTLGGAVEMTIPPMTSSGRTFRLRGKGLPGKDGAGDILVTTEVALPAEPDEALLDFARKRRAVRAE